MKISRSSWHYKMQRFLWSLWDQGPDVFKGARSELYPKSLCSYFWITVLLVIISPLWVIAALVVFIVYIILLPFVWMYDKVKSRRKVSEKEKPGKAAKPKKEPLVRNYIKARKEKVCPRIELVD